MPVSPVTYWEVTCDDPSCPRNMFDVTGEFSALADEDQAREAWENADGVILPDGRVFCPAHWPICENCGVELDPDGRCEECPEGEVTPQSGHHSMTSASDSSPSPIDSRLKPGQD